MMFLTRINILQWAIAITILFFPFSSQAFLGDVSCSVDDSDCNRCVNHVEESFHNLQDHKSDQNRAQEDSMVFAADENHQMRFSLQEGTAHVQGMGQVKDWVILSRSGTVHPAGLIAIDSHSKNPESYVYQTMNQYPEFKGRVQNHFGGMQAIGHHVVVGNECYPDTAWCTFNPASVVIFNASLPEQKLPLVHVFELDNYVDNAAAVAIQKLKSGRYLLIVGSDNMNTLRFFESEQNSVFNKK